MTEENDKHFSNSKEELEFYKNTYKLNFEELSSCKSKIKVLENINNKLKEKITQTNPKNIENNDSMKVVFTNNEFKKFWESMIQTELIESFDFCIKEYKLIAHFSQDMMLLIYEETKKIIEQKFLDILKCLNLSKTSKDKKDNLYMKMMPFFRENFNNIFEFNDEKMKYIKEKLKNVINQYNFLNEINLIANASSRTLSDILMNNNENNANSKGNRSNRNSNINPNINMTSEIYKLLENKIRGKNFDGVMKSFFSICLYMLLHDPVLNFDIEKYPKRKLIYYFYNKKDFINVEGFGNEKTPCVIILSPPSFKKKFAFSGLKPAAYILSGDMFNSEILQQCKINEKKREEESKSKENNEEIKDKKILELNNSNENENKLKKNTNFGNSNINKNIVNSKPLNYNKNTIGDKKKYIKSNKDDIIEYNNNTTNNNMKNNYVKILNNKSLKTNKSNGAYLNENNDSYKLINRNKNINDNKNKPKNNFPNQKYINNNMDKNNYMLDNNNSKSSHQNLSHSYIQIQNNIKDKNNKINLSKTKSNDKNNYANDIKNTFYDNNINLMSRKEKTLQGKIQKNNEFIVYDNNPFLNSSQKIGKTKDIINNNNYISQNVIIKDIYENNKQKDNMSKNFVNHQLNINSKSFDKNKKFTKSHTSNANYIDNKNINIYLNEENQKNTYSKLKKGYNDKIINYNITSNNNNKFNYKNNYDFEKYPKSNGANTPSSEKINIKYYSSLGSILNKQNYNFSKRVSDTTSNNINNYYYTDEKRNNKEEYDQNIKEKKINFYSYGSTNYNNIKNENMNKYTERRGIVCPINDNDYNNNANLSKNSNIINNSNFEIEKKKNYESSSHKKNFNVLKINNNSKDKKQYYHSLKKNKLNPLFNFINTSNEKNVKYTIYDLKEKKSLNNKLNYIDNFNSPNNINYYNNIYNNNSSLINCNNIYENLNNLENFCNNINGNSKKQLRSNITDNRINKNNERRNKDKDLSRTTPESKNYKLGNSKMNKFGGQNSMEIKIKENNKKEINDFLEKYNQLSKERNQLEKCFAPIYLDVHNKTKKNKKIYDNYNNNNNNVNGKNEDDINISNNNNFINGKNKIFGSKQLLMKNKTNNEGSLNKNNKYNIMENNLNKKRNKSLNNNIQKIINDDQNYYIINNISDIMFEENGNKNKNVFFKYSGDNLNKIEYDDDYNDNYNNSKGTNNTSYNLTNYYLNEIEVLKLNDKYKFNDE